MEPHTERRVDDNDFDLVLAAREGDDEAAGILVERHLAAIHRFVFARCRDRELAADLTQETFRRAIERLESLRDQRGGSLLPWLLTVAGNLVRDHFRSAAVNRRADEPPSADLETSEDRPDDHVLRDERADAAAALLDALSPSHAEVLRLRFLEGLTVQEAADRMGRSYAATATLQSRALAAARDLAESLDLDDDALVAERDDAFPDQPDTPPPHTHPPESRGRDP